MGIIDKLTELFGGGARSGPQCVACDSKEVTLLAPQVYRCDLCGYEGGDGYAAYQQQVNQAALQNVEDAELLDRIRAGLESARLSLVALTGGAGAESVDGWHIALDVGGHLMGGPLAAMSAVSREERDQAQMERDRLLLQVRSDLVGLRPALAVLGERGRDVHSHIDALDRLAATDNPGRRVLASILAQIGNGVLG